jgi:hypothetical protein
MNTAPQKVEASDFSHKEYNVTPFSASLCCTKIVFILEPEYAVTDTSTCCVNNKSRVAYGEMTVDRLNTCGCCYMVNGMSPGCGCEQAVVDEIASELQLRVGARGQTGQIQRAEETKEMLKHLEAKMANMERKIDTLIQTMSR